MQAIETKFYPATSAHDSRIRAQCAARTIWLPWNHSIGTDANHAAACAALVAACGWGEYGRWVAGVTKAETFVHVAVLS